MSCGGPKSGPLSNLMVTPELCSFTSTYVFQETLVSPPLCSCLATTLQLNVKSLRIVCMHNADLMYKNNLLITAGLSSSLQSIF